MSRAWKTIILFISFTLLSVSLTATAFAELKIGYIRSDYIFSKYEPYLQAQKEIEEFLKKELDGLQKRYDDFKKKEQDMLNQEMLMSPETKKDKTQELAKEHAELEQYYEQIYEPENGLAAKKQAEKLKPIIDRINEVLMRVAKDEEYDYIFDATPSAAGSTILYANERFDISDQIIEELQKGTQSQ